MKQISDSAWNLPELLAMVDHDRELLRDLLAIFYEEFPRHIGSLQRAVAAGDLKNVTAIGHTLKGMLANLAATRAAAAASRLELMARAGEKGSLQEALDVLQREANALLPEFAAYLAEVSS